LEEMPTETISVEARATVITSRGEEFPANLADLDLVELEDLTIQPDERMTINGQVVPLGVLDLADLPEGFNELIDASPLYRDAEHVYVSGILVVTPTDHNLVITYPNPAAPDGPWTFAQLPADYVSIIQIDETGAWNLDDAGSLRPKDTTVIPEGIRANSGLIPVGRQIIVFITSESPTDNTYEFMVMRNGGRTPAEAFRQGGEIAPFGFTPFLFVQQ
jgi:hypothetical protein